MPYAPDLAGSALQGRYELHALIGEGTFGRVYRGLDRRLQRPVAIKVIKPWWAEDPDWAERFEREAQMLARLSDPGIVRIFDVGQSEEGLYYVAELVEGESLAARLRRGRPAPGEAADVARQLCGALAHTHAAGVIHRDIKPANVLLTRDGQVKLGDFSLARSTEGSSDGPPTLAGTPRYMAPEQARGLPATPATDLYSVGVVLYEMLAGRPPFDAGSPVEVALRHLQEPPPPLPGHVPRPLVEVVMRALAKEPADRYGSAAAMAGALGGVRAGGVRPTGIPVRGRRERGPRGTLVAPRLAPRRNVNPPARRRAAALLAAVAALIVVMLAAAFLLTRSDQVRVPAVHGLSRAAAKRLLAGRHLKATFVSRYATGAPRGSAIAQSPAPATQLSAGRPVRVVLSAGPPPVRLPSLHGDTQASATAALSRLGLHATTTAGPAPPGTPPGTVIAQTPDAGRTVPAGATVHLSLAEVPRWRTVHTFDGTDGGSVGPFRIHGGQWRLVYRMSYVGTCTFIFFCNGPTAHVRQPASGAEWDFGLHDGDQQVRTFSSGPGEYGIQITPGSDTARWTLIVQDRY